MRFKLLLIDDNISEKMLMQEAIEEAGLGETLELDYIGDADKAFAYLKYLYAEEAMPQMIFLDLNMPIVSGFEILREIKSDETLSTIMVYVVTNSDNKNDMLKAFEYKADGYLQKPNDFNQMVMFFKAVKRAIETVNKLSVLYIDKYYMESMLSTN